MSLDNPRWTLHDEAGNVLPDNDPNWITLRDNLLQREYGRTLPKKLATAAAAKACAKLDIAGHTDWHHSTREEQLALIKDGASKPATIPQLVGEMKTDDWYSTSTPVPGNEDYFFVVSFYRGRVSYFRRDNHGWVRPVRSLSPAPSSQ